MKEIKLSSFSTSFIHSRLNLEFKAVLSEFESLGIWVNPVVWFSTEWFCPDQVEGIGIPFYLQSTKVMNYLEKNGARVEGKTKTERADLFRHEISHVVDNCYGLRKLKKRQELFGLSSIPYPDFYVPRSGVKSVNHLDDNYWQSHPCEDFAETLSFVVKNWSKVENLSTNPKVLYCVDLIKKHDVFSTRKKQNLSKAPVDEIANEKINLGDFIYQNLTDRSDLLNGFSYSDGNTRLLAARNIKKLTSKNKMPWAVDNLRQLLSYKENFLGQKTFVSKQIMSELESGNSSWLKEMGLDRIYM